MQTQTFCSVCGLLSSSSPLLLGWAVLQYMYKKSVYSSLTFVILCLIFSIQVSFSRLEVDRNVCQLPCYNALLPYFMKFNLKHKVYEIPVYLLHIQSGEQIFNKLTIIVCH
jgi:hypothetical protein